MQIVILGNGPSIELFKERPVDVPILGCNYAINRVDCDYLFFVDAYAAKHLRKDADYHWVAEAAKKGQVKLIFGERAMKGLASIKRVPADPMSMAEDLLNEGIVDQVVEYPEFFREDQELFSSGHLAFYWATKMFKDADIHMFGFDAVFTGESRHTWSREDLQDGSAPGKLVMAEAKKITKKGKPEDYVWRAQWEYLFNNTEFNSATFYGYKEYPVDHLAFNERIRYDRDEKGKLLQAGGVPRVPSKSRRKSPKSAGEVPGAVGSTGEDQPS